MNLLSLALAGLIAYLLGSIPFGVIFSRLIKGIDVRNGGSRHMGALNTWRMAGLFPAVLVAFGDMGKALVAIKIAQVLDPTGWAMPVAGAMAVVGHCWPIYVGFRGGVGIASGMAMIFYLAPLAALVMVAIWGVWVAILRHFPRSQAAIALTAPFVLWAFKSPPQVLLLGILAGGVIFVRHIPELQRETFTRGLK
ncbi:MAG: glycerol-3-phosphate acyltransferase [Anaerolineae bacterium]